MGSLGSHHGSRAVAIEGFWRSIKYTKPNFDMNQWFGGSVEVSENHRLHARVLVTAAIDRAAPAVKQSATSSRKS